MITTSMGYHTHRCITTRLTCTVVDGAVLPHKSEPESHHHHHNHHHHHHHHHHFHMTPQAAIRVWSTRQVMWNNNYNNNNEGDIPLDS